MIRLDRLLWRLLVASCGFVAAVLASVALVAVAAANATRLGLPAGDADAVLLVEIFGRGVGSVSVVVDLARLVTPGWLIFVALAEVFAIRGLFVHLLAFAGLAAATAAADPTVAEGGVRFAAAVGFVAGFVDWLVAGRGAGFLPPRGPATPPPGGAP